MPGQFADGPQLLEVFLRIGGVDLDAERGRRQAGTDANALRGQGHVLHHFRRLQMRPFFVNGHVELAELQLADKTQSAFQGKTRKTKRGTCDVHNGLRCLEKVG